MMIEKVMSVDYWALKWNRAKLTTHLVRMLTLTIILTLTLTLILTLTLLLTLINPNPNANLKLLQIYNAFPMAPSKLHSSIE